MMRVIISTLFLAKEIHDGTLFSGVRDNNHLCNHNINVWMCSIIIVLH